MLIPLIVFPMVSMLTRKPSRETLELTFGIDEGGREAV